MTGTLPAWLEQWLGLSAAESGEGVVWTLKSSWALAPWATLSLVLAAIAFVAVCYVREASVAGRTTRVVLASIRLALMAIVLLMLAQFSLGLERTGLPYVAVIVDDSASMSIRDRYEDEQLAERLQARLTATQLDEPTRLNMARLLLLEHDAALLRYIDDHYKLRVYFVSDAARPQTGELPQMVEAVERLEPSGETSRLGDGVHAVLDELRGTPPAAVVLLTDGITTAGESLVEAAGYAKRRQVPLFTVAVGSETPTRDVELSDLLVDDVAFVDDVVQFEFKITSTGYEGRALHVTLRDKQAAAPLATLDVEAGPDGKPQSVQLPYRPTKIGEVEFVVEVEPQADEIQPDNNREQHVVNVRKEQIRVLLVQSYPNYEFRYLKQLLSRDSTIALKTVLQEADPAFAEIDETALSVFPVRREELFAYDVILFGDVNPSFLGSMSILENIAAFVTEKGGGLVFIAGPRYTPSQYSDTPLAPLLPIDFDQVREPAPGETIATGFQILPTELGAAMPPMQLGNSSEETAEIWQRLPPLYWLFETPKLKPAARVLARRSGAGDNHLPAIVMQYVGAGKVLFHATDETWRWRWRVGDVYFARYWVQMLRWLSRSKLLGNDRTVELTVDRSEYRRGESPRLRARFLDDRLAPVDDHGVTIVVEQDGHQNRRLELTRAAGERGLFEGVFSKPAEGRYHAWIAVPALEQGSAVADFRVVAPPGEFERMQLDAAELKRVSSETQGHYYTLADVDRLTSDLPRGRQVPIEGLPPLPIWNRWPLLLLFLSLAVSEWLLRKRVGML